MSPKNFEIFEEEARVRLQVRGKTLEDLFLHALGGMAFYLKPQTTQMKRNEFKEWSRIKVEAMDITSLLVEFLSRALAESDLKSTAYSLATFEKFGENFLEGKIFGTKVDNFDNEIKAVSFEGVDIRKDPEKGWYETILVFEV